MEELLLNLKKEELIKIIKEKEQKILMLKKEIENLENQFESELEPYDTGVIWQ